MLSHYRYDDYQFFGEALSQYDRVVCSDQEYTGNATSFSANARRLIRNLTDEAPRNNGFLVGSVGGGNSTVYGLGQCWEFVNRTSCQRCLLDARMAIHSCIPRQEGRVLNSGCYLRYATTRFYDNSTNAAAAGGIKP